MIDEQVMQLRNLNSQLTGVSESVNRNSSRTGDMRSILQSFKDTLTSSSVQVEIAGNVDSGQFTSTSKGVDKIHRLLLKNFQSEQARIQRDSTKISKNSQHLSRGYANAISRQTKKLESILIAQTDRIIDQLKGGIKVDNPDPGPSPPGGGGDGGGGGGWGFKVPAFLGALGVGLKKLAKSVTEVDRYFGELGENAQRSLGKTRDEVNGLRLDLIKMKVSIQNDIAPGIEGAIFSMQELDAAYNKAIGTGAANIQQIKDMTALILKVNKIMPEVGIENLEQFKQVIIGFEDGVQKFEQLTVFNRKLSQDFWVDPQTLVSIQNKYHAFVKAVSRDSDTYLKKMTNLAKATAKLENAGLNADDLFSTLNDFAWGSISSQTDQIAKWATLLNGGIPDVIEFRGLIREGEYDSAVEQLMKGVQSSGMYNQFFDNGVFTSNKQMQEQFLEMMKALNFDSSETQMILSLLSGKADAFDKSSQEVENKIQIDTDYSEIITSIEGAQRVLTNMLRDNTYTSEQDKMKNFLQDQAEMFALNQLVPNQEEEKSWLGKIFDLLVQWAPFLDILGNILLAVAGFKGLQSLGNLLGGGGGGAGGGGGGLLAGLRSGLSTMNAGNAASGLGTTLAGGALTAGGLIWGGIDAYNAVGMSEDWLGENGTHLAGKIQSGVGGFFGGTGPSIVDEDASAGDKAKGVLAGAGKGALIGAGIGSFIPGIGTAIGGAVGGVIGGITHAIGGEKIAQALSWLGDSLKGVWDGFTDWAGNAWDSVKEWGANTWDGIKEGASNMWTSVTEGASNLWTSVSEWGANTWDGIKEAGSKAMETVTGLAKGAVTEVAKIGKEVGEIWSDKDKSLGDKLLDTGGYAVDKVKEGWDGFTGWVGGLFGGSHANGLDYVPRDDYAARLHKGEMVLNKGESDEYRSLLGSGGISGLVGSLLKSSGDGDKSFMTKVSTILSGVNNSITLIPTKLDNFLETSKQFLTANNSAVPAVAGVAGAGVGGAGVSDLFSKSSASELTMNKKLLFTSENALLYDEMTSDNTAMVVTGVGTTNKSLGVLEKFQESANNIAQTVGSALSGKLNEQNTLSGKVINAITSGLAQVYTESKNIVSTLSRSGLSYSYTGYGSYSRVMGSHKGGLDEVPFDGYVAELHKGEGVLTKQENDSWRGIKDKGPENYALSALASTNGWFWPVPGVSNISSQYGSRTNPITGQQGEFHNGIDIAAAKGKDIIASQSGSVAQAYNTNAPSGSGFGGYGQLVVIAGDNGLNSLYAHNSKVTVTKGSRVIAGEKIGEVGTTGSSTGNHLHFTVGNANTSQIGTAKSSGTSDPLSFVSSTQANQLAITGSNSASATTTIPLSDAALTAAGSDVLNGFPYYKQNDKRWGSNSYPGGTIASNGCGPTSLAMVMTALLGTKITPDSTAQWISANGLRYSWDEFDRYGKTKGVRFSTEDSSGTPNSRVAKTAMALLNAGNQPLILSGKNAKPFSAGGHFVVAVRAQDASHMIINNPAENLGNGVFSVDEIGRSSRAVFKPDRSYVSSGAVANATATMSADQQAALNQKLQELGISVGADSPQMQFLAELQNSITAKSRSSAQNQIKGLLASNTLMSLDDATKLYSQLINDPSFLNGNMSIATEAMQAIASEAGSTADFDDMFKNSADNKSKIYSFFRGKGLSAQSASGIIGNLQQESQLDPTLHQRGGPGRGLAQWEQGSGRYNNLVNFAKSRGKSWDDLETQLLFMWSEMTTSDIDRRMKGEIAKSNLTKLGITGLAGGFEAFKKLTDINYATALFEGAFERAGKPMMENRYRYANDAFSQLGAYKTGGFINRPELAHIGEDAPAYPEFIIPTNPAYRDNALRLFNEVGAKLGISTMAIRSVSPGLADVQEVGRTSSNSVSAADINKVVEAVESVAEMIAEQTEKIVTVLRTRKDNPSLTSMRPTKRPDIGSTNIQNFI